MAPIPCFVALLVRRALLNGLSVKIAPDTAAGDVYSLHVATPDQPAVAGAASGKKGIAASNRSPSGRSKV